MRTGRPPTYDQEATWKICEECGGRFYRADYRPMTAGEWRTRHWCSWACRTAKHDEHLVMGCDCCRRDPGWQPMCRGFCHICYEWLRARNALTEPGRTPWIRCFQTFATLRRYDIPGIGRRPALRQAREPLWCEAAIDLEIEIRTSYHGLMALVADPLSPQEIRRQGETFMRGAAETYERIKDRETPAWVNAQARLMRSWVAVASFLDGQQKSPPMFGGLSQN